jgi:hypothetical protein
VKRVVRTSDRMYVPAHTNQQPQNSINQLDIFTVLFPIIRPTQTSSLVALVVLRSNVVAIGLCKGFCCLKAFVHLNAHGRFCHLLDPILRYKVHNTWI